MSASKIIDPYFFEGEKGHALTVDSESYVEILYNSLVPEFKILLVTIKGRGSKRIGNFAHYSFKN